MANAHDDLVAAPFSAFNFSVEITKAEDGAPLCSASFSDCDGLDMTMEVKTIREGGNNGRQIRLSGPMAYGQVTLKRGMTGNFDLWEWFQTMKTTPSLRADALVVLLGTDRSQKRAEFLLSRCVPVKLKAPTMNAKDGIVAIEEFQLAYEMLTVRAPGT